MEQGQNQNKNETQEQQDQPSPITKETHRATDKELQSSPQEIPTKNTRENLLKQVVDDSEDQNKIAIFKIMKKWLEKLWSMVEQAE